VYYCSASLQRIRENGSCLRTFHYGNHVDDNSSVGFLAAETQSNKVLILVFAMVYMAIELGFFSANIIKFMEGGWITVVLAGSIGVCMYAWYNGRLSKQDLSSLLKLKNISILKDMKLDETIPKYATNLLI
jgi:KUP system potassium uptake protein